MQGSCQVVTTRSISAVLEKTPTGKVAMFRVTSIPTTVDDWICGAHVFIKNGMIYDCMTESQIDGLTANNLLFVDYINL